MDYPAKVKHWERWDLVTWMADDIPDELLWELDDPFWMLEEGDEFGPKLVPIVFWKVCRDC